MSKRTYPTFHFQQFQVEHNDSAMKLGVDGVLLPAWADLSTAKSIYDVGSGCGIVSLVCAQRNSEAFIYAVEIEEKAFKEASYNFKQSPWSDRLSISYGKFQDELKKQKGLDVIISNPPFFLDSLASEKGDRALARHNVDFDFDLFFQMSFEGLNEKGMLYLVFPTESSDWLIQKALNKKLYIHRLAAVLPTPDKESKRSLFAFGKEEVKCENEEFAIETGRKEYTAEYIKLVKDFYLEFSKS